MTAAEDPQAIRDAMLDRWERSVPGWVTRREEVRAFGMPVSERMIDAVSPQPGQRLLELAAGVGDTGLIAAQRLRPGGTLVSSDAAEGMLEAARARARELGVENVEFKRLELEWIDLPTASVDIVLCRWGLMLALDPGAALSETRRVLRPGGRLALAVWDHPDVNLWATIPMAALVALGHVPASDPSTPGMFTLADPGRLTDLLEGAGFTEVTVEAVDLEASFESLEAYIEDTADRSLLFGEVTRGLSPAGREAVRAEVGATAAPFTDEGSGALRIPARSLVGTASA